MPNSPFSDRDMLAEVVQIARSLGIRVIPWLEYGLMILPDTPLDQQYPQWITLDKKSSKFRIKQADSKPDHCIWLNPCHPEVQKFMVELVTELVTCYDIDGIQLDDHFGFPIELGYDAFTQNLYKVEHRGKAAPQNHADPAWNQWAADQVTHLLRQLFSAVKLQRRDCLLSLSPNPLKFSRRNYMADWQTWIQQGLVEELVLQVYRHGLADFSRELDKPEVRQACDRILTAIGILAGLRGANIATGRIQTQLQAARLRNFSGVAFFFYETIVHQELAPQKVARPDVELKNLFV